MLAAARLDELQARVRIDVDPPDLARPSPAPFRPRRSRATFPARSRPLASSGLAVDDGLPGEPLHCPSRCAAARQRTIRRPRRDRSWPRPSVRGTARARCAAILDRTSPGAAARGGQRRQRRRDAAARPAPLRGARPRDPARRIRPTGSRSVRRSSVQSFAQQLHPAMQVHADRGGRQPGALRDFRARSALRPAAAPAFRGTPPGSDRMTSRIACASAWRAVASRAARSVGQLHVVGDSAMEVGRAVAGNHRQPAAERRRIAQRRRAASRRSGRHPARDRRRPPAAPAPGAARGPPGRSDRTGAPKAPSSPARAAPTSRASSDAWAASNRAASGPAPAGRDATRTSIC